MGGKQNESRGLSPYYLHIGKIGNICTKMSFFTCTLSGVAIVICESCFVCSGLNIFYSRQNMKRDWAEQKKLCLPLSVSHTCTYYWFTVIKQAQQQTHSHIASAETYQEC